MIICFTGTGNSRLVADLIGDALGDSIERLAPGFMKHPEKMVLEVTDGRLIWILPVHSWGIPYTVAKVISKINISSPVPIIHHLVCTCGDDIGYADNVWRRAIESRDWVCGSAFSVQMPNTYVFLPGFDVDSEETVKAKLEAVPERVNHIIEALNSDTQTTDVVRGRYPWIKTNILYPLFLRFLLSTKPFHATDACKRCGRCTRNCPLSVIDLDDESIPRWNGICTMCSRCYHLCPHHAVAYGTYTKHKGQYLCPGYKVSP